MLRKPEGMRVLRGDVHLTPYTSTYPDSLHVFPYHTLPLPFSQQQRIVTQPDRRGIEQVIGGRGGGSNGQPDDRPPISKGWAYRVLNTDASGRLLQSDVPEAGACSWPEIDPGLGAVATR